MPEKFSSLVAINPITGGDRSNVYF